jgi:hypothetical protein
MTHIALATCSNLPAHEHDDETLHQCILERGMKLSQPAWNDPEVDWSSFDVVVIRTTWDYTAHLDDFIAWSKHVTTQTLLFNPSEAVVWNSDKRYLRELEAGGVPIVPTTWIEQGSRFDLEAWASTLGSHKRGFFKPVVGANAQGTHRFSLEDSDELRRAQKSLDEALTRGGLMLQPYRHSVEREGEVSLVCFGGQISHAVRKIPVADDYRVQDDWGAHDEPLDWATRHPTLGPLAMQSIKVAEAIIGQELVYARADFLSDDAGRFELNELELIEPSLFFRHGDDAELDLLCAMERAIKRTHRSLANA